MFAGFDRNVKCPQCGLTYSMGEAISLVNMQCPKCNIALVEETEVEYAKNIDTPSFTPSSGNDNSICVGEVYLSSSNKTDVQAIRQFISSLPKPICLEYAGCGSRRQMLVRGPKSSLKYIAGQISAVWPKAYLKILDHDPIAEPLHNSRGGEITKREFVLGYAEKPYLPIRIWDSYLSGDPVVNIFSAVQSLQQDERVWLQVFAEYNARPKWLTDVQKRLKMEQQRGFVITETAVGDMSMGANSILSMGNTMAGVPPVSTLNLKAGMLFTVLIAAVLATVIIGLSKGIMTFSIMAVILIIVFGLIYILFRNRDEDWSQADLAMIRQKVISDDTLIHTMVRIGVWAERDRIETLARRMFDALSQYSMTGGNRFVVMDNAFISNKSWPNTSMGDPEAPHWCWMSADELSGMWHLPVGENLSLGLAPVSGYEVRAPDPQEVQGFYKIGESTRPDGDAEDVHVSAAMLERSSLLVGKTGAGKSSLMEHLILANMQSPDNPAVIVIDPHGDLAERLYGTLPAESARKVRILDIGDPEYMLSYNPLDVQTSQWEPDQIAQDIIDIGSSLWTDYWGPRMQVPLKYAVLTLAEANSKRPAGQALGLSLLNSVLMTSSKARENFIKVELTGCDSQDLLLDYFTNTYDNLSQNFREQIIQPVLSKASRFVENPMLGLISTPYSSFNLAEVINDRLCLIVNTRMSKYGQELSGFMGSLLINLLIKQISRQGEKQISQRIPVVFVIDEFQTYSGVSWQELLAQLRKFGGRTVLGTQSLASLRTQDDDLVGQIMAGIYSIFGFSMNGEDAEYLAQYEFNERNGGPSADTLSSLNKYYAYVRMLNQEGNLTRPFFFKSRPPLEVNIVQKNRIWSMRKDYSIDKKQAIADAKGNITYFTRYMGTLLSGGVPTTPGFVKNSRSNNEATRVVSGASAGISAQDNDSPRFNSLADLGIEIEKEIQQETKSVVNPKGTEIANEEGSDIDSKLIDFFGDDFDPNIL